MARRKYSRWSAGTLDIAGVGNSVVAGPEGVGTGSSQDMPGVVVRKRDDNNTRKYNVTDKLKKFTNAKSDPLVLEVEDESGIFKDQRPAMNGHSKRIESTDGPMTENPISPRGQTYVQEGVNTEGGEDVNPRPKGRESRTVREAAIDVLYENQRGFFLCGIPLFSSKSLLNFDPSPWQTRDFKYSPVSILDKQCPDPSWEWAWKTWYVDMTTDVDDQGWAYSFSFNGYFSWHGTHVWFHSFVRRRRWLRKRVKILKNGGLPSPNDYEMEAHGFNQDYFTIHSQQKHRGGSVTTGPTATWRVPRLSASVGGAGWGGNGGLHTGVHGTGDEGDELGLEEDEEISDLPKLMKVLRRCTLDRQRIKALKRFVEEGGAEVYYLAERMSALMSLLTFQESRRQLLAVLNQAYYKVEEAHSRQYSSTSPPEHTISSLNSPIESPTSHLPERPFSPSSTVQDQKQADERKLKDERRLAGLKEAVKAADQEVKKLEFWSDMKDVVRHGQSGGALGEWEDHGWEGLDNSGPDVMKADIGKRGGEEENGEEDKPVSGRNGIRRDKGKGRA